MSSIFGQSSLFGGQQQQSMGGGGLFGQPQKTTTTSLFAPGSGTGQTGTSLFGGGSGLGQQPTSLFGGSGQMGQPQQQQQTSTLFGSNQNTQQMGTSLFGPQPQIQNQSVGGLFGGGGLSSGIGGMGNNQSFGQGTTSGGLFGENTQTQQGGSSLFGGQSSMGSGISGFNSGGNKSLFGGNTSTPTFGGQTTSGGLFGGNTNQSSMQMQSQGGGIFGGGMGTSNKPAAMTSLFGSSTTPSGQTGTGGLFGGQTNTTSNFGMGGGVSMFTANKVVTNNQPGTGHIRYNPTKAQEVSNISNKAETIVLFSITAMPEFANKSLEELRAEDFKNKKNGIMPQTSQFNLGLSNPTFGASSQGGIGFTSNPSTTSGSSLFGGQSQSGGLFQSGNKTNTQSSFFAQPNTQNTGGGLFSGQSTTQTSGGLFGGTTSQQGGSSIFGQQSTSSGSGLFGGLNQTSQGSNLFGGMKPSSNQQGSNLFGGQGGTSTGPSLFGGQTMQTTTPQPSSSLFGGVSQPQTSLFGNQPTSSGNILFNTSTSTQPTNSGTSLFSTPSIGGTSLFGGDNKLGGGSSSLFGGNTGGSLFGGTSTGSGGIFGNDNKTSTGSLFGGTSTTPMLSLSTNPTSLFGSQPTLSMPQGQNQPQPAPTYIPNSLGLPIGAEFLSRPQKSLPELMAQLQKSLVSDSLSKVETEHSYYKTNVNLGSSRYSYYAENYSNFEEDKPKKHSIHNTFFFEQSSPKLKAKRTNQGNNMVYNFRPPTAGSTNNDYIRNIMDINSKITSNKSLIEDSSNQQQITSSLRGINLGESVVSPDSHSGLIEIRLNIQEPIKLNFHVKVNKHIKISLLKSKIVDRLKEENNKQLKKVNVSSFVLMKKHNILRENMTVDEAGIKDRENLHILMKAVVDDKGEKQEKKKKTQGNGKSLAPIEKLPILTKGGYKTNPDFKVICRMSEEELKNVRNFSISNEYGKIEFNDKVDLTELNLDKIISIEDKSILVYQDYKPEEGTELNKAATIHLYKCFPKVDFGEEDMDETSAFIDTLKRFCREKNAEFVDYDGKSGEWTFRVENFN